MSESLEETESLVSILATLQLCKLFDLLDDEVESVEVNLEMVLGW